MNTFTLIFISVAVVVLYIYVLILKDENKWLRAIKDNGSNASRANDIEMRFKDGDFEAEIKTDIKIMHTPTGIKQYENFIETINKHYKK